MRELKKSLKEGLSEGGGQVELLAAVVNLEYDFGAAKQMWLDCSIQPIELNQSSQEGCQGNMTRGENQLDWNVFFRLLSLLLFTLVIPGGPPREPLFHDLPCGTWKQMVFFSLFFIVCHNVCGPVISRRRRLEVRCMFKCCYQASNFMCVYQAEPHQGFDKHVCPRIEKDSDRAGYRITILGQELLMHVRKKGKREKKSF